MKKEVVHSLILILAIAFAFVFPKTALAQYELQLSALLFATLFIIRKFTKTGRLSESVIFTLIVFTIVNTTGGVSSPFFFLIYFLLFALALILEPIISLVTTFACIIFFILNIQEVQGVKDLIPIFSLAFLTPFALFMGQEYLKEQKSKIKMQKSQTDTFLFLSLMLKNQLKNIKAAVENFMGDHELSEIKKSATNMEKFIEKFENEKNG